MLCSDQFSFSTDSQDRYTNMTPLSNIVVEEECHVGNDLMPKHFSTTRTTRLRKDHSSHSLQVGTTNYAPNKRRKISQLSNTQPIILTKQQQQKLLFLEFYKLLSGQDSDGLSPYFHKHAAPDIFVLFQSSKPSSTHHYVEVSGASAAASFLDKSFLSFPDGVFALTSTAKLCEKKNGSGQILASFRFEGTKVLIMVSDKTDVMIISNPMQHHAVSKDPEDFDEEELEVGEIPDSKKTSPKHRHGKNVEEQDDMHASILHPDDDLMALAIDPLTHKISSKHAPVMEIIQGVQKIPEAIRNEGTLMMYFNTAIQITRIEFEY